MSTKKRAVLLSLLSLTLLVLLPYAAVSLVDAMDAMGAMIILMLVINPIASIVIGVASGQRLAKLWFFPLVFALLFLPCYWLCLGSIELDLAVYSAIYLVLGYVSALLSHVVSKIRK